MRLCWLVKLSCVCLLFSKADAEDEGVIDNESAFVVDQISQVNHPCKSPVWDLVGKDMLTRSPQALLWEILIDHTYVFTHYKCYSTSEYLMKRLHEVRGNHGLQCFLQRVMHTTVAQFLLLRPPWPKISASN